MNDSLDFHISIPISTLLICVICYFLVGAVSFVVVYVYEMYFRISARDRRDRQHDRHNQLVALRAFFLLLFIWPYVLFDTVRDIVQRSKYKKRRKRRAQANA